MNVTNYTRIGAPEQSSDHFGALIQLRTTNDGPQYLQIEGSADRTAYLWATDLPLKTALVYLAELGLVPGDSSEAVILVKGGQHEVVKVREAREIMESGAPVLFFRADGQGGAVSWRAAQSPGQGGRAVSPEHRAQLGLARHTHDSRVLGQALRATGTIDEAQAVEDLTSTANSIAAAANGGANTIQKAATEFDHGEQTQL